VASLTSSGPAAEAVAEASCPGDPKNKRPVLNSSSLTYLWGKVKTNLVSLGLNELLRGCDLSFSPLANAA